MAKDPVHAPAFVITEHDHSEGDGAARITLVEYGDFECPYSREAVKTVQILQRDFGHDFRFVFRHFPLAHKHPHAVQAAEAAEAAAAQGKFWPMYAMLFAHQWELEYRDLMDYAGQLELDRVLFGEGLKQHRYLDRVRADAASGHQYGVTGTPTFFVNGHRQDGADDVHALSVAIRKTLGASA
ncbi:MAG: DsbA family protein [Nitrospira sp.]